MRNEPVNEQNEVSVLQRLKEQVAKQDLQIHNNIMNQINSAMPQPQEYLPFDLEKALAGWPVVTRQGRPVTQLHHFTDATCVYTNLVGVTDEMLHRWLPDGRYVSDTKDYDLDLFLLPQPAGTEIGSGYLNIYHNHEGYLYPTKELADAGSCDVRRNACVAVKWINKP